MAIKKVKQKKEGLAKDPTSKWPSVQLFSDEKESVAA